MDCKYKNKLHTTWFLSQQKKWLVSVEYAIRDGLKQDQIDLV